MTPTEIEVCRKGLHWSYGRLAREARLSRLMVRKVLKRCYPPRDWMCDAMREALTPHVVDLQEAA